MINECSRGDASLSVLCLWCVFSCIDVTASQSGMGACEGVPVGREAVYTIGKAGRAVDPRVLTAGLRQHSMGMCEGDPVASQAI